MSGSAFHAVIREVMTPDPWVLPAEAPLVEAVDQMLRRGYRHGLVVDGAGRLAGVVHDFQLLRYGVYTGDRPPTWLQVPGAPQTVGELSTATTVVVGPQIALGSAIEAMLRAREDLVVVVDNGRHPIGIVTEHDGVRVAADVLPLAWTTTDAGTWPVYSIPDAAPTGEAMRRMLTLRIRHLVVTREGIAMGVVSWRDLASGPSAGRQVGDAMRTTGLVAHTGQMCLREAARRMWTEKIGCIPILDAGGVPIRIVTRTDILRALVRTLEDAVTA
jgi:CBS domain-containing protein